MLAYRCQRTGSAPSRTDDLASRLHIQDRPEDFILIPSEDRHGLIYSSVPGYMRSTLRTPGPCARPGTAVSRSARVSTSCERLSSVPFIPARGPTRYDVVMSSSGHRAVSSANHRSSPNNGYVTFYDWSTSPVSWHKAGERLQKDGQHSKLPARPPKDGTTSRTKMKQWITVEPNARNYSGRMFLREKTSLTKGEKEIITGICKNRGDMPSGKTLDEVGQRLFTHRDAWLVGKQIKPSLPPVEKDSASEDLNVDLRINSVRGKDSGFSERSTPNGTPRMSIESAEHWEHVQRTYNHHRFRVRSQRGKENPYEDLCERPSSPVGTNTYKVIPQITDAKRVEVYLPKLSSTDLEEDHPQDQGFEEEEVTEEDMESERGGMGEFVESEEEEENEEDEELMMTTPSSSHVDVTLAPPCTPTSQ